MSVPGTRPVGGRYRLASRLGSGARSKVYLAHDEHFGTEVVLKLLDRAPTTNHDAFQREVRALAGLTHPSNIRILDFGQTNIEAEHRAVPYVVFERFDGRTLRDLLQHNRRLAPERALTICCGVLDALTEAHEQGIVHGDVKPENVLIGQSRLTTEHVKLIDYGSASIPEFDPVAEGASRTGSPHYAAPEVIDGEAPSARSDVYAVGILLFEAIAGRRPHDSETTQVVLHKALTDDLPELTGLVPTSPRLAAVVRRASSRRPDDRFASAADMRSALKDIEADELRRFDLGDFTSIEAQATIPTLEALTSGDESGPAPTVTKTEGLVRLVSNEKATIWVLGDDPATREVDTGELLSHLAAEHHVRYLGEDDRFILRWELEKGTVDAPWLVVFGGMHVLLEDPLLDKLRRFPEVTKVLFSSHRNVELLQSAVNWCGLDHVVTLPQSGADLARLLNAVVEICRRRQQQYDCLRLSLRDALDDRERLTRSAQSALEKEGWNNVGDHKSRLSRDAVPRPDSRDREDGPTLGRQPGPPRDSGR